jgi:hypothetical protein
VSNALAKLRPRLTPPTIAYLLDERVPANDRWRMRGAPHLVIVHPDGEAKLLAQAQGQRVAIRKAHPEEAKFMRAEIDAYAALASQMPPEALEGVVAAYPDPS